jgi:murein DD-endopeptidase MepM/ murein hydrolase activator NlpD
MVGAVWDGGFLIRTGRLRHAVELGGQLAFWRRARRSDMADLREVFGRGGGILERITKNKVEGARARLNARMSRLFRDREIFLRGIGRLDYIRLTRMRQVALSATGLGLAVWVVGATAGLVYLGLSLGDAEREIEKQRLAHLEVLTEAEAYHSDVARLVGDLEANQSLLMSRLAEGGGGAGALDEVRAQLKDTEIGKARTVLERQGLQTRLREFETAQPQLAVRKAAPRTLRRRRGEDVKIAAARERLDRELRRVEEQLAHTTAEKVDLERQVAALDGTLLESQSQNDALASEKAALHAEAQSLQEEIAAAAQREAVLDNRVSDLEIELAAADTRADGLQEQRQFFQARADKLDDRLDEVSEIQVAVVQRLTERTLIGIDMIERVVAMTGLNVNDLMKDMDIENLGLAQGGPFVPGDFLIEADPHLEFRGSVALLDQQMDRWEALQEAVRTMPLSSPLDYYRVTGRYGERTDPVNGRKAMHFGIDLKAPMRTPVIAPAPGTVVFAGWSGRYGRLVEIEHDHGILTRYAHLQKILVKKGQEVAHRDEIGLLGSSGRSTGPHLHYEIMVNDKPKDPSRFLMAGRNAFKG